MHIVEHNVGPKLMIAIPTLGRPVPLQWALNFKSMNPPINYNCDFNVIFGREIGDARNGLAQSALDRGCKYLFFLGDDTVAPPHTLRQLIFRMEQDPSLDVVGGVYCAKADPPAPLVFQGNGGGSYWDWKIGEYFQCTGLGMDCTLIRTSIFNRIEKPWFLSVDIDEHVDGLPKMESWTEDLYFCKKVTEANGKICCDAAIICQHHDVYGKRIYELPHDSLPMRQKTTTDQPKALILGPLMKLDNYDITHCSDEFDPAAHYRVAFDCLPFEKNQFEFVVVTKPIFQFDVACRDWDRVTKPGGKIAIRLHPALSWDHFMRDGKATRDGDFLVIEKPPDET